MKNIEKHGLRPFLIDQSTQESILRALNYHHTGKRTSNVLGRIFGLGMLTGVSIPRTFALKTTDFLLPSHIYWPILVNRLKFVWLRKAFELSIQRTKNKYTPRIKEYLLTRDPSKPDYLYDTDYVSPY